MKGKVWKSGDDFDGNGCHVRVPLAGVAWRMPSGAWFFTCALKSLIGLSFTLLEPFMLFGVYIYIYICGHNMIPVFSSILVSALCYSTCLKCEALVKGCSQLQHHFAFSKLASSAETVGWNATCWDGVLAECQRTLEKLCMPVLCLDVRMFPAIQMFCFMRRLPSATEAWLVRFLTSSARTAWCILCKKTRSGTKPLLYWTPASVHHCRPVLWPMEQF